MADTIYMTRPTARFFLPACCVIAFLAAAAFAKEPKTKEKEKDIAGLTYMAFQHGAAPNSELLATLAQQMHWDNGGAGNLDRMAVHLRFEKVDEAHPTAGGQIRYRIFAEGAPENKVYGLSTMDVGKGIVNSEQDVYVNAQGLVMSRRPSPEEEDLTRLPGAELYLTPSTVPGLPTRYAVSSRDRDITAFGTILQNPVVNVDRLCRLEARIGAPGAAAVLIVADGFTAKMKLPIILESQGELVNIQVETDHNGHAVVAGFPFIQGKTQGVLKASAQGENCLPSVQVPWDSTPAAAPAKPASATQAPVATPPPSASQAPAAISTPPTSTAPTSAPPK
jgi:hypothetical protein